MRGHRRSLVLVALVLALAACGDDGETADAEPTGAGRPTSGAEHVGPADEGIEGVEAFRVASNEHTEEDLRYDPSPPVGGDHFPVPATCGFYEEGTEPPEEMLVHSLEHGAVWVAYDPDLDEGARQALSSLVAQQAKVIATPHDGLDAPLVVSAWGRQLELDDVADPRLQQFIDLYRNSGNAPEPYAACQGAGEPAVAAPAA